MCYKCTGSLVASGRLMRTFSATKLKRFSQRSSENYTGWPKIHGFHQKYSLFGNHRGTEWERWWKATKHIGDETLFNVCTIPTVLKHEVFGLSGKPAMLRQPSFWQSENVTDIHIKTHFITQGLSSNWQIFTHTVLSKYWFSKYSAIPFMVDGQYISLH